jgi:hypothetical protein
MATERSRLLILGTLVVVLVAVIARMMWPDTSTAPAAASNPAAPAAATPARRAQNRPAAPGATAGPDVHLDALNAEHPKPETERNLFRFKPKAPPPPPPSAVVRPAPPVTAPEVPTGPPPPPPLAPISLKFIGIIDAPSHGEKIAILSDGRNTPFYGKEGAIIEGRFRILKIGVESVELAYADGRGRQTIRLTGS